MNTGGPTNGLPDTDGHGRIRADFARVFGAWDESWQQAIELLPDFVEAHVQLHEAAARTGSLTPEVRQLVHLALASAATHLHTPSVERHVRAALALGASPGEVLEVFALTSTLGIHACTTGIPLLLEVLTENELRREPSTADEQHAQLKADFVASRGYWNEMWDGLLELAPDFFAAYTKFSSAPWQHGFLRPHVKELIYLAFDISATHLYEPGAKLHMRNALKLGADVADALEVMTIATLVGSSTCAVGLPILAAASGHASPTHAVPTRTVSPTPNDQQP
jgi:alkylhydroperoxidase/carboxymuconolactone decarboxylase family protein YurZ